MKSTKAMGRRRMPTRLAAVAIGLTMVVAACGGDSSESGSTDAAEPDPATSDSETDATVSDATVSDATVPDATVPDATVPDATVPDATDEQNSLEAAWTDDWALLGLKNPGLETTDLGITIRDTSEYAKEGPYTIGFASQGPTNSWATIYDESMRARADELGVTLAYAGADGREDKQVNDINDLLAQDIDALIVTPMGPAVKAPIERAAAQGIPVIVCTGTVDTDAYVTRVDRDNRLNGAIYAEWIAQEIGYEGQIVMLEGIAGVPTSEARSAAAEEVFAKYPDIEILDKQYTNWSPTEAKTVMEQLVTRFGDEIDAVWSDSGFGAIGVIEVYSERGLDIPPVTGEPVNAFLKLADETDARVGIVGYPPSHSADCLDAAMSTLAGEPLPTFVNVEVPIFDDTQLDEWVEPDCSDDLWVPVDALSPELLSELDLC